MRKTLGECPDPAAGPARAKKVRKGEARGQKDADGADCCTKQHHERGPEPAEHEQAEAPRSEARRRGNDTAVATCVNGKGDQRSPAVSGSSRHPVGKRLVVDRQRVEAEPGAAPQGQRAAARPTTRTTSGAKRCQKRLLLRSWLHLAIGARFAFSCHAGRTAPVDCICPKGSPPVCRRGLTVT